MYDFIQQKISSNSFQHILKKVVNVLLWPSQTVEPRFRACHLIDPGVIRRQTRVNTGNVDVAVLVFRIDAKRYVFSGNPIDNYYGATFVEGARSRHQAS